MDWEKAKKIVIIVLIILNAGLFGLNYNKNERYKVTQSEEKAIYNVLGKNGINLYTEIIKEAMPMRTINVKPKELSADELKKEFFKDEEVNISVEFNKTILKSKERFLTLQNNHIKLENYNGTGKYIGLNGDSASNIVENYIKDMPLFAGYKPDNILQEGDGYIVEFIKEYKDFKLFNSKARFFVTDNGIMWFESGFYEQEIFSGEKKNLCMPDEALLTFMYEIKKLGIEQIYINQMELGYDFTDKAEIAEGSQLKLYPAYRIYTSYSSDPFIINAYTNELKKY